MDDKTKSRSLKFMLKDFFGLLEKRELSLYLFGMGSCALDEAIPFLEQLEVEIKGIVDNNEKKTGRIYHGIPILSFSDFKKMDKNSAILITAPIYANEIENQLKLHGFLRVVKFDIESTLLLSKYIPKTLKNPIQIFPCSVCSTDCKSCCYRQYRKKKPSFQMPFEEIMFLNDALIEYNTAAYIQFVGGESLLWKNIKKSIVLLNNNPNVRQIEIYTAGIKNQLTILDPIIELIDWIHFSLYHSNGVLAEELEKNYGNKVIIHDIPEHFEMNDKIYPLTYPVRCDCPNLEYLERQFWLCPWVPLNLRFQNLPQLDNYRSPIDQILKNGIPAHWVHGSNEKLCGLCVANISRRQFLKKIKTP